MTTTYADIHVKVKKETKEKSEEILSSIGITMSDLINMTLKRVIYERQIPFNTLVTEDDAPKELIVNTREELDSLLDRLSAEEEERLLSNEEAWGEIKNYINKVEMRRKKHANL